MCSRCRNSLYCAANIKLSNQEIDKSKPHAEKVRQAASTKAPRARAAGPHHWRPMEAHTAGRARCRRLTANAGSRARNGIQLVESLVGRRLGTSQPASTCLPAAAPWDSKRLVGARPAWSWWKRMPPPCGNCKRRRKSCRPRRSAMLRGDAGRWLNAVWANAWRTRAAEGHFQLHFPRSVLIIKIGWPRCCRQFCEPLLAAMADWLYVGSRRDALDNDRPARMDDRLASGAGRQGRHGLLSFVASAK